MIKKLLFVAIAISLLASCNNQNNEEATAVTTTEFATVAENMIDQTVTIEGTVMHVCKHGGKKMFISDDRIKIIVSESIGSFDAALEGSEVTIRGIIREEAVPVLAKDEQKLHADSKAAEEHIEEGEAKHEEGKEDHGNEAGEENHVEVKVAEGEAAACSMEEVKPLYVIEVVEVTEKIQ